MWQDLLNGTCITDQDRVIVKRMMDKIHADQTKWDLKCVLCVCVCVCVYIYIYICVCVYVCVLCVYTYVSILRCPVVCASSHETQRVQRSCVFQSHGYYNDRFVCVNLCVCVCSCVCVYVLCMYDLCTCF